MKRKFIYFDNAATSHPKPDQVIQAAVRFLKKIGANPGRSGHRLSIEAARIVFETRELAARLFGVRDSSRIVFGLNATEAINQGLFGVLRSGDHVITSSMEHNSVMRPLRAMEKAGVELTIIPCSSEGLLDPEDAKRAIHKNTKMIVLNHGSNVTGTLQPIADLGALCQSAGLLFFVDAAQTAGAVLIDAERDHIDLLAFTGHKSLFGPQGTGGLIIGERIDEKQLVPLKRGGTGSRSEFEDQPDFLPDLCESGTPNTVGLAGLRAGLEFILEEGVEKIRAQEIALMESLLQGLREIPGITIYGPAHAHRQIAIVSFNVKDVPPATVSAVLDERFGVLCRPGLHCSPSSHKTIGTFPQGTVRFSLSCLNTPKEVETALQAVKRIAAGEN
jgi:cysteine desulfurase family protein